MNHVLPPRKPASSATASAGAPDAGVFVAVLAGIAGVRALVGLVSLILQIAQVNSQAFGWVQGIIGGRGLFAITVVVLIGLLSALDARGNTGSLRVAALGAAALAVAWSWGLRFLPDSLRPESNLIAVLLFSVVPMVAGLLFAHWIAALLVNARRQPMIAIATWWGVLVTLAVALMPQFYVADALADLVVGTVVTVDLLRLRALLL